ncbi:MAG: alkaline phosphatase PafA [Flavisolibacter sp.]
MKKFLFFLIVLIGYSRVHCQQSVHNNPSNSLLPRPKLVVGIVVDQMRWDFIYKYYNRYGSGGFKRMLSEGFTCENTMINYIPSVTAVGHSSIFTGSVPAINGITENQWIDQLSGKWVYCTSDSTVQSVGVNSATGKMSPRNLLTTTITDELRIATNFQSKVVGISLKDRASILPAGHAANAAFWFDDASGSFITSSYYMQSLPDWVIQFNNDQNAAKLLSKGWQTLYPVSTYQTSDSDVQDYEGLFRGENTSSFPHNMSEIYKQDRGSIRSTPFGNTLTLNFAKQAIEGYHLGEDAVTDFLTVNCASTDYVGHMFGPNSIEIEDTYLRLDQDLSNFFSYLDKKVGKDQYTVFLTADHGVEHTTPYMLKHQLPAFLANAKTITDSLNHILAEQFQVQGLIRSQISDQVDFDLAKIHTNHLDFDKIKTATVDYLKLQPGIAYAIDLNRMNDQPIPLPLREMIINGYYYKRSSQVRVILNPGWLEGERVGRGASHGTSYPYDIHLPLLFMGWGIRHGVSHAQVNVTDIAPTISALLHIQMPSGCVGRVIGEVIK